MRVQKIKQFKIHTNLLISTENVIVNVIFVLKFIYTTDMILNLRKWYFFFAILGVTYLERKYLSRCFIVTFKKIHSQHFTTFWQRPGTLLKTAPVLGDLKKCSLKKIKDLANFLCIFFIIIINVYFFKFVEYIILPLNFLLILMKI